MNVTKWKVVEEKVNILIVPETKLDSSFSTTHFLMKSLSNAYRFDRHRNRCSHVHIDKNYHILSRKIVESWNLLDDIDGNFIEPNLMKCKWLDLGSSHPLNQLYLCISHNVTFSIDELN